jgi:glutathione peroxidase-family protein
MVSVSSVLDFTVTSSKGIAAPMREVLSGRVALIANTASACGLTPQYEGLQKLQDAYSAKGFTVVAFPCNQFGGQEPGSQEDIEKLVCGRFKGTFPIMKKIEVNGDNADPLWVFMKAAKPGFLGFQGIKWNFTKFLVDKEGRVVERVSFCTRTQKTTTPQNKP